ncbi:polyprenyl synthetase family protein [Oceanobacillus halophilus]|uniref:Farnesyl diphosphate synthase n=1 Tax=Oceanobacillus halophilus TaxID=930130 RepID=A0A495ACT3_9BACI|nr:farnesyl diphosphate synthase [Oceanobacillus halophilus]RKQ37748.1 polyprenyl synthetase family protein [Oceanobacillus halophilus]
MPSNLNEFLKDFRMIIEEELSQNLQKLTIPKQLKDSMLYSVEAGGKRLRPILLLASYKAYDENYQKALSSSIALEMVHTYSLIHDDLPAMDDDNYRRGKLTNHKAFDEATAILAGDALLTYSFELIGKDTLLTNDEKVEMITNLSASSGPSGMVAGQFLDMDAENRTITLEELEQIHMLKTGKLLEFAIYAGAYLAGATKQQLENLKEYSFYLGLIFQVQDDILDITGDEEKLGKPVGSDEGNEKGTYPKLLGLDGAINKKKEYVNKAVAALEKADAHNSHLMALTEHFSNRDH